ncbi:hypothetical protein ANO14919_090520 [Xylariales sp. No.14919]|nr:hypothetical protein ANO14919_090520 [Xylariales sp. No.14919]
MEYGLWQHREVIAKQSPKYQELQRHREDMISYRTWLPTDDDPGPKDGTNIRHMIVLMQNLSSALVTFMLLADHYADRAKVIVETLNLPCNDDSTNQILISTYNICGEGLNLQRANYCVMMEPPTITRERQAAARVNHQRQDIKTKAIVLEGKVNPVELAFIYRRMNQEEL